MASNPAMSLSVMETLKVGRGGSRFMMFLEDEGWYSVLGNCLEREEGGGFTMFLAAEGWYSVIADCLEKGEGGFTMFIAAEGWSSVLGDCLESEEAEGDCGGGEVTASDSAFTLDEALEMLLPGF